MARAVLRGIAFGVVTTGLLMGCVQGDGADTKGGGDGLFAAPAKRSSNRDVEAPEVFQATDSALWDGRPSLGGIWVASPDATTPERVTMFNPANGQSVTGALFKRERDNPGPRLQLSSDAADALGILAGQPTEIKVTALRKEEVEAPAEATAEAASTNLDPADAADAPESKDGEAAAIASAALDAVEAGDAKPAAEAATDAAAEGAAAAVDAAADGTAAAVDEKPKRKTWKERRAEAKAAREAKKKAAAEAKAAAAAAAAGTAPEGEAPTATPDASAAAVEPIESAPLDARNADVVAPATDTAPAKEGQDTVAPAPDPAPAAEPAATGPARPIQVASFSKEENATRAAEALAKIGITATPQKSEQAGKAVWGVVVMGDETMLKKIKDAGFADAYFLK